MNSLLLGLIIALIDTLLGFSGVVTLKLKKEKFEKVISILIAFAAGSLLGGAFFHLLPEALDRGIKPINFSVILIIGFLTFLILEEWMHWHRCEDTHKDNSKVKPYSYLMIIGDFIHNIIDGFILIGAILTNTSLGIITTIMILAHELPEELGIFAVLVRGKMKSKKAIYYSVLAQSSVILGVILGYFLLNNSQKLITWLLPFAAGGFLYISASDLIPEINNTNKKEKNLSTIWIIVGLVFMLVIKLIK